MSGEDTPEKSPSGRERSKANLMPPWKPGQSGNPAGRPKGSRNKLSEDFFSAMARAFEQCGEVALARMIEERPADFIKTIAGLQSKELTGEGGSAIGIVSYPGLDDD